MLNDSKDMPKIQIITDEKILKSMAETKEIILFFLANPELNISLHPLDFFQRDTPLDKETYPAFF